MFKFVNPRNRNTPPTLAEKYPHLYLAWLEQRAAEMRADETIDEMVEANRKVQFGLEIWSTPAGER